MSNAINYPWGQTIYEGTAVTSECTFYPAGSTTPTDPTTVTCVVKDGIGNTNTYTYGSGQITKVSAGVYSITLNTDGAPGWWTFQWEGSGAVVVVLPSYVQVTPAPL